MKTGRILISGIFSIIYSMGTCQIDNGEYDKSAKPKRNVLGAFINAAPGFFGLTYARELDWNERVVVQANVNPYMPYQRVNKTMSARIFEAGAKYRFFKRDIPRIGFGLNLSYLDNLYWYLDQASIYKKTLTSFFLNPYLSLDITVFKRMYISLDFGIYSHVYEFKNEEIGPLTKAYIKEELKVIPDIKLTLGYEF